MSASRAKAGSPGVSTVVAESTVDVALEDAATHGERIASKAKILLGGITIPAWLSVSWGRWLVADIILFIICTVLIVHSVAVSVHLRHRRATRPLLLSSIAFESLLIGAVPLSWVITREETWFGAGKLPGTYAVMLALVCSGFRLSRRAVLFSAGANGAWLLLLLWLDFNATEGKAAFSSSDWIVLLVLTTAAASTAYFFASRARLLALQVATQTAKATRGATLLGAYLSKDVAQAALAQDELRLGGDRKMAAVLFSDLRGYTAFSEGLDPEELVAQLNRYLAVVVNTVAEHGGVVDKFIGDGMMAVFGIPEGRPDDAARAVQAAFALQDALKEHNADRALRKLAPLRHGVGLHFGEVIAGNIGTADRASFTVIGDTVNLAARLESMTKDQDVDTLMTEDAIAAAIACGGTLPPTVAVGELKVRGRDQPVPVVSFSREVESRTRRQQDGQQASTDDTRRTTSGVSDTDTPNADTPDKDGATQRPPSPVA